MHHKLRIFTLAAVLACAAALTAALVATAIAAGVPPKVTGSPKVTIRIEGSTRTLLATTTVRVPSRGSIVKDGAPKGKCPAASAAGVLNVASKGRWSGSWSSKYDDYLITKILGDTESGSTSYWEILLDNVAASTGACEIKLHTGNRLVFAAVPLSGKGYPLATNVPTRTTAGRPFRVTIVYYNAKGARRPIAGATVTIGRLKRKTDARGVATFTVTHAGKITIRASKAGYVRAASVTVTVRG